MKNLNTPHNRKLVFDWLTQNLKPIKMRNYLAYCWDYVDEVIQDCADWNGYELSRWNSKSGNPETFSIDYLEV